MKDSMLAAMYYGIHDVRIEYIPIPKIGADDVLIKMARLPPVAQISRCSGAATPGCPNCPCLTDMSAPVLFKMWART